MRPFLNSNQTDYRADIDGLRGLAVLSVIVFHINKNILPGGFVGVDIFFVISGYLITQHIFRDLNSGSFSIVEFYRRRVKRIIPAMLAVVFIVIIAAQLLFLPRDAEKVAESGLWSLLSASNVYFWLFEDLSYFAAASNEKPLLHLWSLGVEEQFYIFWPLVLLGSYKFGHGRLFFPVCAIVTIVSFVLGEYLYAHDPSFVYYMLPTRAGELLFGGLLAQFLLKQGSAKINATLINWVSIAGLVLIVSSLFVLSEEDVFPGFRAIPPTLGAVMLIFSGHYGNSFVSRLLKLKPVVLVGLVSYSAYLWHWPILAFYRYGFSEVALVSGVSIFIFTLLIGWLSYRFIETPFRNSKRGALQVFVLHLMLPVSLIAFIALLSMKMDGYGLRWFSDEYKKTVTSLRDETRPAYHFDYVCQSQSITQDDVTNDKCVLGREPNLNPGVILFGDSNAAHYVGIIGAFAKKEGFAFRNLQVGSCPPINVEPDEFVDARRASDCRSSRKIIFNNLEKYQVIIMSANWIDYQKKSSNFMNVLFETVQSLASRGKKIILLGKAPVIHSYDRLCREKAISFPYMTCDTPSVALGAEITDINKILKDFAIKNDSIEYYDFNKYLCPNGVCNAFDDSGKLIYYDSSHLSLDASWELGSRIIDSEGVPYPFNGIK